MKDIEKTDVPGVSGGYSPSDGSCFPELPVPDYPQNPIISLPEPLPGPPRPGHDIVF
jgi:hypothetical protein